MSWGMPDVFRCLRCEYWCAYSPHLCAHQAAGALGTRHSARLCLKKGESFEKTLGRVAPRSDFACIMARDIAAFSTVIVRLGWTIQHSRDAGDEKDRPRRTGSPACAGDDGGGEARSCPSLRGALATKQSSLRLAAPWIASLALAKTRRGATIVRRQRQTVNPSRNNRLLATRR
jgi:hypothetical protein